MEPALWQRRGAGIAARLDVGGEIGGRAAQMRLCRQRAAQRGAECGELRKCRVRRQIEYVGVVGAREIDMQRRAVEGQRLDVTTAGMFIQQGVPVTVVKAEGIHIVVRALTPEEQSAN